MHRILPLIVFLLCFSCGVVAQDVPQSEKQPADPKMAFLKSLAMPGWGHYSVDKTDWRRGQYHLAAEATLLLSYFGLRFHSNNLQQNWYTYARLEAGVDIEVRDRAFQLAVGNYDDLQAYNNYQERSRNWNQLYNDVPDNNWNWQNTQDRRKYQNLRDRFERIDQQLPALLSLMVVNRVVSAISAYNRARKAGEQPQTAFSVSTPSTQQGVMLNVTYRF